MTVLTVITTHEEVDVGRAWLKGAFPASHAGKAPFAA